jgi:hypothetical protein
MWFSESSLFLAALRHVKSVDTPDSPIARQEGG